MKLQHLAVIFVIIIVPIALVLSTYTDGLIKVINNEEHYDTILTNATYDAIRAYQMNTLHNSFASVNNSRERDINASVNSFFNSLSLGLGKSGYSKTELNEYVPSMLFTLYDGYYVYGPFKNIGSVGTVGAGNGLKRAQYSTTEDTRLEYGLMPYTYYSCEYKGTASDGSQFDLVINYSLDNYISISGTHGKDNGGNDRYITASGYYINSNKVQINESTRTATLTGKGDRDITITPETLGEYISFTDELKVKDIDGNRNRIVKQNVHETPVYYNYINYNEVKYYLMPEEERNAIIARDGNLTKFNTSYDNIPIFVLDNDVRVFINNDMLKELAKHTKFEHWDTNPMGLCDTANFKDVNAFNYYKNAKEFSEKVHPYLKDINIRENADGTYGDVKSVFFNNQYEIYPDDKNGENFNSAHVKVSYSELSKACPFDYTLQDNDPEEEISMFNNHRIDVIVSSIESSLVNAIGNFNNYVSNTYSYAMPTLSENDWYKIANNLTTVSFMQGLPVGKYKFYSNYAVVTNKKNKEFIGRDAIYIQDTTEGLSQAEHEVNYKARSLPEFHSPSCEEYNKTKSETENSGTLAGVVGYRNIDYEEEPVLNTYPKLNDSKTQIVDEDLDGKRDEITQSLNYYFQPGTGAYECIISRNQNRITTDDLIGQKSSKTVRRGDEETSTVLPISKTVQTAYISALAREKGASYKHHSGLNYHRYMHDGTQLGENIDKTYNDIDQNFSDENNLNVPTVTDPDYNGEVIPITPPEYSHDYYFNGKVVSIKVGEEISSSQLVDTDIPGMPTIKSITDMNIVTNNIGGITGSSRLQGLNVGQTSVFLEISVDGTTYTARSTVIVTPADIPPAEELDSEEIKIYEVATTGEREITNTKVTLLTNEKMDIHATKTEPRDILTTTSSDTNKIKIPQWNNATDRGTIKANTKTITPVTVTTSGNMIISSTGTIASASFECEILEQIINLDNITISAGETKRLGTDDGADIKIDLVKEEKLIYELYTIPGNEGAVTLDSNTGTLTGNSQGSAILIITGETSGATRQVIITVSDNRAIYYATLHSDGTLAFANTEETSKISGKVANKTYTITLGTEQKFITNQNENNNVSEVRFIEEIKVRGPKIEWFTNWKNLKKIVNEGNLKTDNIMDMRKLFYNCSKLEGNLDLNSWNTSNVQYMERMFEGCESVKNIYLSNWNTQNVRNMENMFKDCKKLEKITANATTSTWNVNNVLKMQYMFNGCLGLKTATLNNWDTGNVNSMEYMFADCISLEGINISTWNTLSLKDTRYMFSNCKAMKTVIANSSAGNFTTANVENMSYMFVNCENVVTFSLNGWDTQKTEKMQSLFSTCSSLQNMDLSSWITSARTPDNKEKDQEMMFNNCTALRSLNLYDWTLGQKVVSMFNNCKELRTNTFNIARIKTTACTDMSNMFSFCESLTTLNLVPSGDYWNVSNVVKMVNMFRGCKKMRTINVANWDIRNTTTLENMFSSCEELQSINIDSWNNDWYNDGITLRSMFAYCTNLRTLNLSRLVNQKVTVIANMFESCHSITNFSWNSWNWNISKVQDMSSFLRGGENLATVDLDLARAGGEVIVTNLDNLYTSCRKLVNVTMNNWKANNLTAVDKMFLDCKKLQNVTMTNWEATQITTLGTMLAERDDLRTVNMSNWKVPKLNNINRLLYRTKSLTTVTITNLQSDALTNVSGMFQGLYYSASSGEESIQQKNERESYTRDKLTTANLSGWKCPNLIDMSSMFSECRALTTVNLSGSNTSNVRYMNNMFYNCNRLQTANLSEDSTENVTNMRNMFYNCSNILSINLNSLNTKSVSMYNLEGMFVGCRNGFTLIINSQEYNTYNNYNRAKLKIAYDENANNYRNYYQSSNRYKIYGHYTTYNWYDDWWDRYYYWVGSVNFVIY